MSFDRDEVRAILKTTSDEISKEWLGTAVPLSEKKREEVAESLRNQVIDILSKFSYLGGFEVDKNDIHVTFDKETHQINVMLGGETAKKFVGE